MVALNPTNVAVGSSPVVACPPVGGTTLFYNSMPLDTIYLSYNTNPTPGSDTVPVFPFSGTTMDTTKQVYGICPTNNQAVLVVAPGATAIHQVQPATPSIETLSPLSIILNRTLGAGTTTQLFRVNIARYTSLVATIFAQSPAGGPGAAPFYRVRAEWSFSNDNFDPIITDDFVCATGPFSFTGNFRHNMALAAFCDTVTVFVTNYDTVSFNYTHGFFGSYRSRSTSMRGRYPDNLSSEGTGLATDNIVLSYQAAAIANGTSGTPVVVPPYTGDLTLTGQLTGDTGLAVVRIQPQPSSVIAGQIILRADSHGVFSGTPGYRPSRRASLLTVDNTAGVAPVTPNLLLIGSDSQ